MIWKTLAQFHLGLEKGKVELRDHDPLWSEAFSFLSTELRAQVPNLALEICHIGSTSIPGICAKPVLDVLGVTDSLNDLDRSQNLFEKIGFTWKGEFGIGGRRYLVLSDASDTVTFVHLHVFQKNAPEVESHLRFRNVLSSRKDLADEYDSLKRSLFFRHRDQRELYTESKNGFIQSVIQSVFQIRAAKESEGEALTDLSLRSKSYWNYPDDYLSRCGPALKVDCEYIRNWPVKVLEVAGQVSGFYSLKTIDGENRLDNLWIDLPFIGKGYGRILLNDALSLAKARGWKTLRLAADPGAESFYEKFGARRIGQVQSRIKSDLFLPHMEFVF